MLLKVDDVVERFFAQVTCVNLVRPQVIRHARRHVDSFLVHKQRVLIHKLPSALIARVLRVKNAGLNEIDCWLEIHHERRNTN